MVDEELLRKTINDRGLKMKYVAKELNLTYAGFSKKIKNITDFTVSEAYKLSEILGIKGYPLESKIFLPDSDTKSVQK